MNIAIVTGGSGLLAKFFLNFFRERGFKTVSISRLESQSVVADYQLKIERYDHSCLGAISEELQALSCEEVEKTVLVNNAAVQGPAGHSIQIDESDYLRCYQVNVLFPLAMIRLVQSVFGKMTESHFINVVGGGANQGFPFFSPYAASKVALARITEQLALEDKELVNDVDTRYLCVTPGLMNSGFHRDAIRGKEKINSISMLIKDLERCRRPDQLFPRFKDTLGIYFDKRLNLRGGTVHLFNDIHLLESMEAGSEVEDTFMIRRIDDFKFIKKR